MSLRIRALGLVIALTIANLAMGQVRSDYEVTRAFENELRSLSTAMEEATTVVEIVDIESRLLELERAYREYEALLDRALYPDGYEGSIMKARGKVSYVKSKLTIIEEQYGRISELEAQVRELSGQVEALSGQNAKMLLEVRRLSASREAIDSLNAVILQLKQGLRERDKLIFALVDSLFLQYGKNVGEMSDQEKQGVAARLERRNVFTNVRKAIGENLAFLESTELTGIDIARMTSEQRSFESKWRGLGNQIAGVYAGSKSNKARELALIDTMLTQWRKKLDERFWSSLNSLFTDREIPVESFGNAGEFLSNVTAYVDEEIRKARDEKDGQRYFRYQAFADSVWNMELKPQWLPAMIEQGTISKDDVERIDEKIEEWEDIVSPPLTTVYIVIGVVMLIVVLYLYRRYAATRAKGPQDPA